MQIRSFVVAVTGTLLSAVPSVQSVAIAQANEAAPVAGVPVYPYDIKDRPYRVLGEVKAGVRKATVFSKAADQSKIYRELWERGQKLGADAVIKASYGESHITGLSWGSTSATGTAIKFTGPTVSTPVETSAAPDVSATATVSAPASTPSPAPAP